MKTPEIKRIYQLDRKGFTDSKEGNRKEKDQIEQEIHNFESERLNSRTANQMLPPRTRFVNRNGIFRHNQNPRNQNNKSLAFVTKCPHL